MCCSYTRGGQWSLSFLCPLTAMHCSFNVAFSTKLTLQRNCKYKQCFSCHPLSYSSWRQKICRVVKGLKDVFHFHQVDF